jgi:hypothetical protein
MAVEVFPTAAASEKRNFCVGHNGLDAGSDSDASSAATLSNATYNYYNWHYNYHQQQYPAAQQDWTNQGTESHQQVSLGTGSFADARAVLHRAL